MKADSKKKELGAYLTSVRVRQSATLWPDVLRGGRSVDEAIWKGTKDAPFVQRIGAVILALAYLTVAFALFSIAAERKSWIAGAFAAILITTAGLFVRNALRK